MSEVAKCSCGKSYTQEQWEQLELCGPMDVPAGEDPVLEPPYSLELRNCTCGSTITSQPRFGKSLVARVLPALVLQDRLCKCLDH